MAAPIDWTKFEEGLKEKLVGRLEAVGIFLQGEARTLISKSSHKVVWETGPRGGRKRREIKGANRSKPGEPPHKDTGFLRSSVAWRTEIGDDALRVVVGTSVNYGYWLEMGTTKMAARPWLRPTLDNNRERVRSLMAEGYTA